MCLDKQGNQQNQPWKGEDVEGMVAQKRCQSELKRHVGAELRWE